MQPQQTPLPQQQLPNDYLDQISGPEKKPGVSNRIFFGVIIGGLLIAGVVGFLLLTGNSSRSPALQTLGLRLQTLQKIASNSQRTIKSSSLRATDSNLNIYLTNTNRDIADPLSKNSIDLKKVSKEAIAKENGAALIKALEDARLLGSYDERYAREMSFQLEASQVLMTEAYKSTKSSSTKTFLEKANKDLTSLQSQFADYSSANN